METFYVTGKDGVELTREDALAIIQELNPLGADFVEEAENCLFGMRFFDLNKLSSEDFNLAYKLIMKVDLNSALKDEIKQAFESDGRFRVGETV